MEIVLHELLKYVLILSPIIGTLIGVIWKISTIIHKIDLNTSKIKENSEKIQLLENKHLTHEEKIITILTDIRERMVKLETKMESVVGGRRQSDIVN